jgi:uncharacterized membrane protein YheB (UPF0754 family)
LAAHLDDRVTEVLDKFSKQDEALDSLRDQISNLEPASIDEKALKALINEAVQESIKNEIKGQLTETLGKQKAANAVLNQSLSGLQLSLDELQGEHLL